VEQDKTARSRTRAPGLDGVRALAVLAVMGFHEGARALSGGFLGVDVFFVLSGFLITDLLVTQRPTLKDFWLRRARRLLPALAVMLVVVTAATTIIEPQADLRPALLAAMTYTSNWYQMLHHVSYFASFGPPSPLQHLWSLAIEEQFYLVWPLILLFLISRHNVRRAWITVTLLGALMSAVAMALLYDPADPSQVYYGTDTHASALLIGAALALALPLATLASTGTKSGAAATRRLDAAGIAGLAVLAWSIGHFNGNDPAVYPLGLVLAAVAAAALVAAAASKGAIAAMTSLPPMRWIGVRSYAMYLWHWPVITLTNVLAGRAAGAPWLWILETAITIILAAASWQFVESPILHNGFRSSIRTWLRQLAGACTRPAAGIRRVIPVGVASVTLAVAVVAGYGVAVPAASVPAGLLRQVAEGERLSAASQLQLTPPQPTAARPAPAHPHTPGLRPRRLAARRHAWQLHAARQSAGRDTTQRQLARYSGCTAVGRQVTTVGDSVMLASAAALEQDLPGIYIYAKVGMQMQTGVQLIQEMAANGILRRFVVVGLGTNGAINASEIWQLREATGPHRELILINTYGPMSWASEVNNTLATGTWDKPHVALVNWARAISAQPSLLWGDGIHPQPSGARLYAGLVAAAIRQGC
jgi:peptidoglycan/LPS O-acetylase OafA/YrhL